MKKPGYVFKFPTENCEHGYCQWLPHLVKFFLTSTSRELSIDEIFELPEAFSILVYNDTPGQFGWERVGKADFPDKYLEKDWMAVQDSISGAFSKIRGHEMIPATYEEVKDLEVCAAWSHDHIVERLLAQIHGRPSDFLGAVALTPPA